MEAPGPLVRFKKKKAGSSAAKRPLRRSTDFVKDEEAADGSEDDSRSEVLADLREEQEQRRRNRGRNAATLLTTAKAVKEVNPLAMRGAGVDGEGEAAGEERTALDGTKAVGGQSILQMIDSQFKSGGDGFAGSSGIAHEQLMEAYIEAKLGVADGSSAAAAPSSAATKQQQPKSSLTEEDALYMIPDEMKRTVQEAKIKFGSSTAEDYDGEIGQGAQIAWNTGIAEVDLPIDVKLKNIEETRRAKTAFEQSQKHRADRYHSNNLNTADGNAGNPNASAVVGSFTANYSHHSREYATKMRQREMTRQKEGGWTNKDGTVTHHTPQLPTVPVPDANKPSVLQADSKAGGDSTGGGQHQQRSGNGYRKGKDGSSDDKVYERFKKRTRRF